MPETITIDREIAVQLIIEVDALGMLEIIRSGDNETKLVDHIYRIIEPFERAALGRLSEEEADKFHKQGNERGREIAREWFGYLFEREEVAADAS